MSTRDGTTRAAAPGSPVLFIVDADPQARAVTESALARRFGADYRVVTAEAPQAGLHRLARLAGRGERVALVAADLHLPGVDGVEFLERAHLLHRGASRVLLVAMDRYHTRIPFSELATVQRATALGRIDFAVVKGWVTPRSGCTRRCRKRSAPGRWPTDLDMWSTASLASSGRRAATSCGTY